MREGRNDNADVTASACKAVAPTNAYLRIEREVGKAAIATVLHARICLSVCLDGQQVSTKTPCHRLPLVVHPDLWLLQSSS